MNLTSEISDLLANDSLDPELVVDDDSQRSQVQVGYE